jgi:hypothetical protein
MDESRPKVTIEKVRELINLNPDSHQYFFSVADERWLDWLWENGLLAGIHKPTDPENPSRIPELGYLSRVVEKNPARVVDIMLEVSSAPDAFNPETLDQFLWICSKLPADQLARMVPKIHDENWVRLMVSFNDSGFEYENLLKVLSDAKDYDSLLLLADTILSVRTKEDIQKSTNVRGESPFCLQHLEHTKIFDHLARIDNGHLNRALASVLKTFREIVLLGDEKERDRAFKIADKYTLYDVDFFTLERNQEYYDSPSEQVQELAAVAKGLIHRLISDKCQEQDFVREICNLHIQSLPDSRMGWRLQLYFLSLCPEVFKAEIKEQTFRIFACKMPSDITLGAEYQRFLQATFNTLGNSEQRTYIARIIESGTKKEWEYSARGILSCLAHFLTPEERKLAEASFGPLKDDYSPQTAGGEMRSGWVEPQAPPDTETEWKKPVPDIVNLLKTVWAPFALKEKYRKDEDFLRPIDAEGVAGKLKLAIKARPAEFIQNASLFFDRANLDAHYTYAFFQGISDLLREKKMPASIDVFPILTLMKQVIASASAVRFEIEQPEEKKGWNWLAHWSAVHNSMADIVRDLLSEEHSSGVDFAGNRNSFYEVIKYLLSHTDPSPGDEELATAKITISSGNTPKKVADPLTLAINSVRGRAFQALVYFAYRDAGLMDKNQPLKIQADVKTLYEDALRRENTRAIMFMFGHYLPSFYFRDVEWARRLLFDIFPTAPEKKHLYLAAWEGYLANKLYQDMFFDPEIQKLYQRGIELTEPEDPSRNQVKDPDEMLATHLGLAFMYYEAFNFEHPLFKAFWAGSVQRHGKFVDFLGRMFVSGQNPHANKLLETEPRAAERLKAFWDWALSTYPRATLFNAFGFWMNLEKPIFEPKWLAEHIRKTLEKTKGFLDWDYVLVRSIVQLAQKAPEEILAIARLYLLEGSLRTKQHHRISMHINKEWLETFRVLHNNSATREGTYVLIDDLIREGGRMFWILKDALQ